MTWGDKFTEKEADYALDEAPTILKDGNTFIDYVRFCSTLSGMRKPNKSKWIFISHDTSVSIDCKKNKIKIMNNN